MNFRELIAEVGITPRQVRYLIAEAFVPPPTGGRAHATYGREHVEAIRRYMRLRALGFTPASIRVLMQAREGVPFPVAPGVTLVIDPRHIAAGAPVEPLLQRISTILNETLNKKDTLT